MRAVQEGELELGVFDVNGQPTNGAHKHTHDEEMYSSASSWCCLCNRSQEVRGEA